VLVAGATSTEGSVPSGYAGAGPQCAAGGSGGELLAGGLACTSGPRRDSGGENSEGDEYFDWRLHKACARQRIVGTSKLRSLRRVVAIAKCSEGLDSARYVFGGEVTVVQNLAHLLSDPYGESTTMQTWGRLHVGMGG
jgi:hypothetical protein